MMSTRVLTLLLLLNTMAPAQQNLAVARNLVRQQHYGEAVSRVEEVLESSPDNAEALSLMGAAQLYGRHDFLTAKALFEESFQKGGGATFWVHHSHEKLGNELLSDYCRGWLYFDKSGVTFTSDSTGDSFHLPYSAVKELKQNRLARSMFHIKDEEKTFNFRPRTGDKAEVFLIVAIYEKFTDVRGSN